MTGSLLFRAMRTIKAVIRKGFFFLKYRFLPPPSWSDLSGYELLLDAVMRKRVLELDGDFVEIGVFLGGGTYKLSKLLEKRSSDKKLYAVDIFSPDFDKTVCSEGKRMDELYHAALKGRDQREIYNNITKGCANVITLGVDSLGLKLPCQKIAFAFIDGNHDPVYVMNDFNMIWEKLVSRGIVAMDDYGCDLPQVTAAVDALIRENAGKILTSWTAGPKTIFIQKI
jgi:hypothetical protein